MAVQMSTLLPQTHRPGVFTFTDISYKEETKYWTDMCHVVNSKMQYENVVSVNSFNMSAVLPEGGAIPIMAETQGYQETVYMVYYALAYLITLQEQKQNLYAKVLNERGSRLGRAPIRKKNDVYTDQIFNLADTTTRGDGVTTLSTAHPTTQGTQSNIVASPLSEAALETAWALIRTMRDGSGNLINLMPKNLHVHPNNRKLAEKIMGTDKQVGTANNTKNVIRNDIGRIYDNPYIDDTEQWLLTTDIADSKEGLICFEQTGLIKKTEDMPGTHNIMVSVTDSYSFMIANWRSYVGYMS